MNYLQANYSFSIPTGKWLIQKYLQEEKGRKELLQRGEPYEKNKQGNLNFYTTSHNLKFMPCFNKPSDK